MCYCLVFVCCLRPGPSSLARLQRHTTLHLRHVYSKAVGLEHAQLVNGVEVARRAACDITFKRTLTDIAIGNMIRTCASEHLPAS